MAVGLHLYRQLLREATRFAVAPPVGRKIAFNTREVFEARKDERDPAAVERMHGDAEAALRVIAWLNALPPVRVARIRFRCMGDWMTTPALQTAFLSFVRTGCSSCRTRPTASFQTSGSHNSVSTQLQTGRHGPPGAR